jgi:hypothetical protein
MLGSKNQQQYKPITRLRVVIDERKKMPLLIIGKLVTFTSNEILLITSKGN